MSDECMSRAIAILDTVFKTIESLGGSINSDLSVKIRGDIVRFCMVESQDQVKHEMTKQEAQALVKYNDDIKNHSLDATKRIHSHCNYMSPNEFERVYERTHTEAELLAG